MKKFSVFIIEQDPQNDPFAKFMKDIAQNKGNYDPEQYKQLSAAQQRTALRAAGEAERADNSDAGTSSENQRNATLLQRYDAMKDKTGKSDADINKLLKPSERATLEKIYPAGKDEDEKPEKPATPAKPVATTTTAAKPASPSGRPLDTSKPAYSGSDGDTLKLGVSGAKEDPMLAGALKLADKTSLDLRVKPDVTQAGIKKTFDSGSAASLNVNRSREGGSSVGVNYNKPIDKDTDIDIGVEKDITGQRGTSVYGRLTKRY